MYVIVLLKYLHLESLHEPHPVNHRSDFNPIATFISMATVVPVILGHSVPSCIYDQMVKLWYIYINIYTGG